MDQASRRPGWLYAVWVTTALYLVVELSFNSRLLDVVGGGATMDEVDAIELWGRCISGFALALVLWPRWIGKLFTGNGGWFGASVRLALRTVVVIVCVYVAQEMLVRWLVDTSSAEQLRSAQHLVLLQNGLHKDMVDLAGLDLDREQMSRPDGKAFLAMFPLLGTGLGEKVQEDFGPGLRADVTRNLVVTAMGDPNERMRQYVDLYGAFSESYTPFGEALEEINAKAGESWADYRRKLRGRRINPDAPPRRHHSRIRREVRSSGVPVASDWNPTDRRGFIEAASRSGISSARRELHAAATERFPDLHGVELPDRADTLFTDPKMQPHVLRILGYTCIDAFDAGEAATAAGFKRALYDSEAECQVDRMVAEDGDPAAGRQARRALLIPFIALAFSLFGALAHIVKLVLYSAFLIRGRRLVEGRFLFGSITVFVPIIGICLCAWLLSSPATDTNLYRHLEEKLCSPVSTAIRGTIHGQMLGYPLFEAVRVRALRGFTFGYHGDGPIGAEAEASSEDEASQPSDPGDGPDGATTAG